jgi:hypothetical protein
MLTEAAIIAIAKAIEAGFNYAAEHERGMSQAQREQLAQWTLDDFKAFRSFFDQIRALLPDGTKT